MILEIKDYCKTLNKNKILEDINLKLESGNIYGFYGRNGSGKTMLFRAITTQIYPTSGDIRIDNRSIINEGYDLSLLGVLIENPGFFPYLSGYENLKLLYTINNKNNKQVIMEALKKVGLENVANKPYRTYSLGMKQRLGIAQAIMENQQIIILDEPTNGLDEAGIIELREWIKDEKKKDKIILIASHSKEDLRILCDVIYGMEDGHLTGVIQL
ncbi:MAG: ATP-binding cassette domain-containing protein [Beduini sp.]|uniref:ATP-binding cassette domain-containing protein n=1 Tax=Beduini sp. TaxID=1922300 RepID=UPI0011C77A1D